MTEKKLSDYLPFYLGCRFLHVPDNATFELCGYNIYEGFVQNSLGHSTFNVKDIKPILRRLSSMTEEEAIDIAKIISEPQFIEAAITNVSYKPTVREGYSIQCIDWEAYQVIKHQGDKPVRFLLHLCSWGSITLYVDGQLGQNNKAILVTKELIKKGFWLFGDDWFTEGLIIDADTVK